MVGLKMPLIENTFQVGVLISLKGMEATRDNIVAAIEEAVRQNHGPEATPWPFTIAMGCGESIVYDQNTFPAQRVMCPCGDPNHILVDVVVE